MCLVLIVFQGLFTYAPPLQKIFATTPLDMTSWLVILGLGLFKFLAVEAEKGLLRRLKIVMT
jgi:hypothetical protein